METKNSTPLKEVLKNLHGSKDPALLKLIHDRSKSIRDRVLKEHGLLDVAVNLVREVRDE